MATARGLITRSLRLIHVLDSGESPSAGEANDALEALNTMLDTWSVPGLYIYALKSEALTWAGAAASRTIGASGDLNTTRPTRIERSTYATVDSNDYGIEVLRDRSSYTQMIDKDVSGSIPQYLYYEPTHPLGVLYVYPVPASSWTLNLDTQEQLDQFATLDTSFAYPPGYRELMDYSLAIRLAPEFGVAVPPEVAAIEMRARTAVRRLNKKTHYAQVETAWIGAGSTYDVYSDQ